MENLKIRVNSADESKEVQELFLGLGYVKENWLWSGYNEYPIELRTRDGGYSDFILNAENAIERQEITLPELRAMVHPMKEYLVPDNGGYRVAAQDAGLPIAEDWIAIPEGAEAFGYTGIVHTFYKDDCRSFFNENTDGQWEERSETWIGRKEPVILWQRATHPEELPFVDDEPKYTDDEVKYMNENGQGRSQSLNDQYAEIEQSRQESKEIYGTVKTKPDLNFGAASSSKKDNVNHPSHYADSAIECIDAMEAMMTPEQFIGYLRGNLFKYQWRYEKKNGIEDLKKAQWYLEKLTVKISEKNAPF